MSHRMLTLLLTSAAVTGATAQQTIFGQCGGQGYTGCSDCAAGSWCSTINPYYAQCTPSPPASGQQALYGQCGGAHWTGPTACVAGFCSTVNPYYAQCTPGPAVAQPAATPPAAAPPVAAPPKVTAAATIVVSVTSPITTLVKATRTSSAAVVQTPPPSHGPSKHPHPPASSKGKVQYAGVNVAGFDFGSLDHCANVNTAEAVPPLASTGGPDGIGQMKHFVTDDGLNAFRLPVTWQYLSNWHYASGLDPTNLGLYNQLVQGCLDSGAGLCILDLHNYARWQGQIIGESSSAPSSAQFASLWGTLAAKYAAHPQIAFGLMNEPNDDCGNSISPAQWQYTLQSAVTAIRNAGATSQYILLPGGDFDQASTYTGPYGEGNGEFGADILAISDKDGSKSKLIMDVHQYLDYDSSGTHAECVTSAVEGPSGFRALATWLSRNGRQAIVSEIGGGNTGSCVGYLKQTFGFLNSNSDVFLGYTAWAAGSFDTNYVLSLTPTRTALGWTDSLLLTEAVKTCYVSPASCS